MRSSPQRLAWAVLIASFLVCCALTVGVPTAAWSFINNATVSPTMTVKLQAGRTIAYCPPAVEADARVVSQEGRALEEGCTAIVDRDTQSQGLLTIAAEASPDAIVNVQLYSGARVTIEQARLPRFDTLSSSPATFVLRLQAGRIQVQRHTYPGHAVRLVVKTDLATTTLDVGSYSFEASVDQTIVVAREGAAWVVAADNKTIVLRNDQRTAVTRAGGLQGILPPARNLVINGNFQQPLEIDWQMITDVSPRGGKPGVVSLIGASGNMSLLLDRSGAGLGWGRTGVWQQINEDVSGRRSLQLRLEFAILYQELSVCGGYGSECPLFVKLIYTDRSGAEREWTQGFYADGVPNDVLPDEIITAPLPRNKHVAKRLGQRELFESEDLLATVPELQQVRSIWIYAEGHGVRTQVYSVELLITD
ncbi:MAG: hypothetical protein RMN25_11220 [Anaerolineae bacterium]|nr:FecR family protein [Thermoflexales bacterium]MDW8408339.1 hypothetical protein [Anaerolineae bacterium]